MGAGCPRTGTPKYQGMGVLMPRGGSAPPFCLPLSRCQHLLTPSRGVRGGRGCLLSCPCPSHYGSRARAVCHPHVPTCPPNPPPPGSWGSPTACPSPSQTLLRVWMWYRAGSSYPIPVTAPCPAPVPSVPRGCGRVGVLPLGSWLCFPAVCACVSRPPLIPTPHLGALKRASGAGDPPTVHHRSPPQPPGTSCGRWHTNPLGVGIPAGGQPL